MATAPYLTQAQCEAYLAMLYALVPGVTYQMDPLGNQVSYTSQAQIDAAIDVWEARRLRAIQAAAGETGATVLVRREPA